MADLRDDIDVVLASGSPRRLDLLRQIGIDPIVRPADIDESTRAGEGGLAYVGRLAHEKAGAITAAGQLVVAADTAVLIDDSILGKPDSPDAARAMLRLLSGRWHEVATGVALCLDGRAVGGVTTTAVRFRDLDEVDIDWYVGTGEPFDKAGGYGMQTAGGAFVAEIRGSDSNVIGLPLAETVAYAAQLGIALLRA